MNLFRIIPLFMVLAAAVAADDLEALKRCRPLPEGQYHFVFPAMAKQSIAFVSEAVEEIYGTVSFPGGDTQLGELRIDTAAGTGSGQAVIRVDWMRTGNESRDEHLRSAGWLDAAQHPEIRFSDVKLQRVEGTLWQITGTWTIHGVGKELSSHANVRLIPKMPRVGENLVKIKAGFDIDLEAFGLDNPAIGSPAVAKVWRVTISLLGVPQ